MQSLFFTLLDSSLVLAGHGYDFRGSSGGDTGAPDDGGGLSAAWIIAVVALVVVTAVVLIWMNRREREPAADGGEAALKLKTVAPALFTVAVIAAPLVVWTTSSGGDDDWKLRVERFTGLSGAPELLVSLGEDDLNTLQSTGGRKTVRLACRGRQGEPVLSSNPKWPFILERGYDYPHIHQAATPEQVQKADRCRLTGAGAALEAEVEGSLKG